MQDNHEKFITMKNIVVSILLILTVICLSITSCERKSVSSLPGSTGSTYELLILCSNDVWDNEIGLAVQEFFSQNDTTMFMQESLYKCFHVNKEQFNDNKLYPLTKSILHIEIEQGAEPKVEYKHNLWAQPQRYFKITASDVESFISTFDKYKQHILQNYYEGEREKLNTFYETVLNKDNVEKIGKKFGYAFNLTTGFRLAKETDDFVWLRSETDKSSTNILIYSEDYTTEKQFDTSYIKLKRNLITKQYVPATADGSYAKISDVFPLTSRVVDINGYYAVETRGAWDCYNDFMGGTFLNYTIADTISNKVLTFDAFIYYPSKEKRVFMMQLEAIAYSMKRYIAQ